MGTVLLGGLVVVGAVAWIGFDEETQAAWTAFQKGTVFFLLALIVACVYAIGRSRVQALDDRLIVVNGYRRRELAWAEVVAVNLPPGAPWVTLDLADGTNISAMGIQASDGLRARRAVHDLRAIVAAHS